MGTSPRYSPVDESMIHTTFVGFLLLASLTSALADPPSIEPALDRHTEITAAFFAGRSLAQENPFTGKEQEPVVTLHGVAAVEDTGLLAAIVSSSYPNPNPGADGAYTILFGLFERRAGVYTRVCERNVTGALAEYLEFPGNFLTLDVVVEAFTVAGEGQFIHLHLWSVLAGTGYVSSTTDLFFRIVAPPTCEPILTLPETSRFSRIGGDDFMATSSDLFVARRQGAEPGSLLVIRSAVNSRSGEVLPSTDVTWRAYQFTGGTLLPLAENTFTDEQLRALGGQLLGKSSRIASGSRD